jgi:DUF4097 and DUF4098 domain-containing protein YvlB
MRMLPIASPALALLALSTAPVLAASPEGRFDRTLQVGTPVSITVTSGSGEVTVRRGNAATAIVKGHIKASSWSGSTDVEAVIRRLEQQPPIVQEGSSITVGTLDEADARKVSISYDLMVPEATDLQVRTGSGDIIAEGLGRAVNIASGSGSVRTAALASTLKVSTGSGDIVCEGVRGGLTASSGSGDITASLTDGAEVNVSSASGDVRITGARGAVTAKSSSGDVAVDGTPAAGWVVSTASGDISLRVAGDAGFTIEAATSSGSIESSAPITVSGTVSRKGLRGDVRGGGPVLRLSTASGDISVR